MFFGFKLERNNWDALVKIYKICNGRACGKLKLDLIPLRHFLKTNSY
jgi:hypothetical protein